MKTNGTIQLFPFVRLVIALVIGILIAETFSLESILGSVLLLVFFLAIALLCRSHPILQSVFVLFCVLGIGMVVTVRSHKEMDVALPEHEVSYDAVVVSAPERHGKTIRFDMVVVLADDVYRVKASMRDDERSRSLKVGDGIVATSLLHKPTRDEGSSFDYAKYLLRHRFVATTFINSDRWDPEIVSLGKLSSVDRTRIWFLHLRDLLLRHSVALVNNEEQMAVVAAISLGDKTKLDASTKRMYADVGASHVLALSGLHLSILCALFYVFGVSRKRHSFVLTLVLIITVWAFVVLVGMSVSVVRSALMLTVCSLAGISNRRSITLNTLAFTAFVLLLFNPMTLYDVGFQLSFLAVASIIMFYKPIYGLLSVRSFYVKWKRKSRLFSLLFDKIWQLSCVSLSAQIGVMPLIAYYFHQLPKYFLLSNLIVIPLVMLVLYLSIMLFLTLWSTPVSSVIGDILSKVVEVQNDALSFVSTLPASNIRDIHITPLQVILLYFIILSLYAIFCKFRAGKSLVEVFD
ncbi:MAG: ComEC/Rec2 family competence protein [Bacteroidaceae bacterium]|nr:ComEC/Rec2 family competence protein [Bacteroidaceae bacterium]